VLLFFDELFNFDCITPRNYSLYVTCCLIKDREIREEVNIEYV